MFLTRLSRVGGYVFGLLVQGDVDGARRVSEADRDSVRFTFVIGRRESRGSLTNQESCLLGTEDFRAGLHRRLLLHQERVEADVVVVNVEVFPAFEEVDYQIG